MKSFICILVFTIFFTTKSFGINTFEHFTTNDGLSQNTITKILQDNKGFLWLGTYNGLNRFDGYSFKNYNYFLNDSVKVLFGHISSIFEDSNNNLWIGTMGNGLCRLNMKTGYFQGIQYVPNNNVSDKGFKRISALFEDSHKNIWIGTWAGGLVKFNEDLDKIEFVDLLDGKQSQKTFPIVKQICEDEKGLLWMATDQFLLCYNHMNGYTERFPVHAGETKNDLTSITLDPLGNIWIGSWRNGIYEFDRSTKEFKNHTLSQIEESGNNEITSILFDGQGKLWLGTNGGGLHVFSLKKETFEVYTHDPSEPSSISANTISTIYKDKSNVFWIGAEFAGLNKLYPLRDQFNFIDISKQDKGNVTSRSVLSIYKDKKNTLWMGTFGSGMVKYNLKTGKITKYEHDSRNYSSISHNIVRSIRSDRNNNLWIGTDAGIDRFNRTNNIFKSYSTAINKDGKSNISNVFVLYEDSKEEIWAGCFLSGLLKYNKQKDEFESVTSQNPNNTIRDNSIWSISEDKYNNIWIGTDAAGLYKFDVKNKLFTEYGELLYEQTGQKIDKIVTLYHSSDNYLWLGTLQGLIKFDYENGSAIRYSMSDGLSGNAVQSIIEDTEGNLWIGTINGLCRFSIKNEEFKVYDVSDGIQGNEFHVNSVFRSDNGELIFGGVNGINIFSPEKILENSNEPNIVLTNFLISNKEVPVGPHYKKERLVLNRDISDADEIFLSYRDKMITFEFAALDFVSPQKNKYEYFLEGFDSEKQGWNKIDNRRHATYTNLPPGKYIFKVRGTNNDGVLNKEGVSIMVNIEPPIWFSPVVWLLCSIIIIYLAWFFYKRRVLSVKRKNEELERTVNQRTEALRKANSDLENRSKKIEEQSSELTTQKENLEEINSILIERQEEIEHQSLKLQLQANSLKESNDLLIKREQKIRKQTELLEEQAENLQDNNKKLVERQEEVEHQALKLKVQSDALKESNQLLEERERKIRRQADKLEEQAESLKNANIELEKLNATKDRFFSIIAHDLRNPINAILGFSELISTNYESIEDAKKLELNKIIHSSTKNVYNLLENLLQWSRSQTNRIRFEPVRFDLLGVINENIILSKGNSRKKNIEVITNLDANNEVYADKNMTSTLLRNLLTNAVKFTNPFGKIEITTKFVDDFVQIGVRDSGIGMTDDVMQKLFRIDAAHSTYGTSGEMGTGLGLIICKEFVDKQGGEIWVESEVNKGSKFTFTLPAKEQ